MSTVATPEVTNPTVPVAVVGEKLSRALASRLSPEATVKYNEPLAKRTTLRVGGKADVYVEPGSEADLSVVLAFCREQDLPFMMLGRGSNLLVRDGGVRGTVICLAHANFSKIEALDGRLRCGAGARLKQISNEARRQGLGGLEFLEGIPGNLGGALRMNAGAMGAWTFDAVESVRFMDYNGQVHECAASEVQATYRSCLLFKNHIALGAVLRGVVAPTAQIEARMNECNRKRWDSQPSASSAGCIFKNPKQTPAGKLIDELGLKGTRVGGAVVSGEHGNFIINDDSATARDVLQLIEVLRKQVRVATGIELETEVQIVGED